MRRVGFALQKGLARLSTAVRRERHSRQRPADVKSGYTRRTTVPPPDARCRRLRPVTLGYAGAIQNPENEPSRVLGKAGTTLGPRRNAHDIGTDIAFRDAERHLQRFQRVTCAIQNIAPILRGILPGSPKHKPGFSALPTYMTQTLFEKLHRLSGPLAILQSPDQHFLKFDSMSVSQPVSVHNDEASISTTMRWKTPSHAPQIL